MSNRFEHSVCQSLVRVKKLVVTTIKCEVGNTSAHGKYMTYRNLCKQREVTSMSDLLEALHDVFSARELPIVGELDWAELSTPPAFQVILNGCAADMDVFHRTNGSNIQLDGQEDYRNQMRRMMTRLPAEEGAGEAVHAYLMLRPGDSRTSNAVIWILMAAKITPWTASDVSKMLEYLVPDLNALSDPTDHYRFDALTVIRRKDATGALASMVGSLSGYPTVVGNAMNNAMNNQYMTRLGKVGMTYAGLMNFAILNNYGGKIEHDLNDCPELKNTLLRNLLPPAGGLRVIFPMDVPDGLVPQDFPLTLDKAALQKPGVLENWLTSISILRFHAKWPELKIPETLGSLALPWLADVGVTHLNDLLHIDYQTAKQAALAMKKLWDEADKQLAEAIAASDDFRRLYNAERNARERADDLVKVGRAREELLARQVEALWVKTVAPVLDEQELFDLMDAELSETKKLLAEKTDAYDLLSRKVAALEAALSGKTAQSSASKAARPPENWGELAACARAAFPWLEFSDEAARPAVKAYRHSGGKNSGSELAKAWTALEALNGYGLARSQGNASGTFASFLSLQDHPLISPQRVRSGETSKVEQDEIMRGARTFLSSEGELFCAENIVIGGNVPPATRLHYRCLENSALVFVGYVGPHLPSPLTN